MRLLILLISLIGLVSLSHANEPLPPSVVTAMITAAHDNDLSSFFETCDVTKIANHPRHAMSQDKLLKFLRSINPRKIQYAETRLNLASPLTVTMIEPINMDFDLESRQRLDGAKGSYFVVIGIHP